MPFNGGNTSLKAFALGVPIITLPSPYLRGRITQALYRQMDVLDCVANTSAEYVDLAVRLGNDPDYRAAVSSRILAAQEARTKTPHPCGNWKSFLKKPWRDEVPARQVHLAAGLARRGEQARRLDQDYSLNRHSRTVRSALAESARRPSGETATPDTTSVCPSKQRSSLPVATSQRRRVLSRLPESRRLPSGAKATVVTPALCPWNRRMSWPVTTSHTRMVLSILPRQGPAAGRIEGHAADGCLLAFGAVATAPAEAGPEPAEEIVAFASP